MRQPTPTSSGPVRSARGIALALLLLAGLAASACAGSSDDEVAQEESTSNADPDSGSDTTEAEEPTDDGDEDEDDGTGAPPDGDVVLGSSDGQHRADPADSSLVPLRLEVLSLDRNDDLVELEIAVTNVGPPESASFEPWSEFDDPRLGPESDYSLSGASLVDGRGQKAYLTIVDSTGICLCSQNMSDLSIAPGQSARLNATFGGVPDDLDAVSVSVPGFAPVPDVPISG